MRTLIGAARMFVLTLWMLSALAITVLVFPWASQTLRGRFTRALSRAVVRLAGVRLSATGVALPAELAATGVAHWTKGRLVLANHITWLDIFAIDAVLPSRFVAKAEIGRWPVVGWMVTLSGTLYIERGRRHAVAAANHRVAEHLARGETVAVFPEGTTGDGTQLLPFHSNLVAPALEVGCEIWPVAVRYTEAGQPSMAPAYVGEATLLQTMWRIVTTRNLEVEVALLPPLQSVGATRHALAEGARQAIAAHLGVAADARRKPREVASLSPGAAPAGRAPGTPLDR
ncbi:MAG TPA: lysophospholipid acyltransferase family protein [Burkholderiaceae bacterium]|nr:lysophospholipid acyltransferase family protein [Burkholderiaceae bacterium]